MIRECNIDSYLHIDLVLLVLGYIGENHEISPMYTYITVW